MEEAMERILSGRGCENPRRLPAWEGVLAAAEGAGLMVGVVSAEPEFPMRQPTCASQVLHLAVVLPDGRWADAAGTHTEREILDSHPAPARRRPSVQLVSPTTAERLVADVLGRRRVEGQVVVDERVRVVQTNGEGRRTDGPRVTAVRAPGA